MLRHVSDAASTCLDGLIVCESPAIKAVLQMIEPSAFPADIAAEPLKAAVVDTNTSGNVVPILTIVAPTTICGIPSFLAIATAASTSLSPPRQINASPTRNNITACTIFSFLSHSYFIIYPKMLLLNNFLQSLLGDDLLNIGKKQNGCHRCRGYIRDRLRIVNTHHSKFEWQDQGKRNQQDDLSKNRNK